MLKKSKAWRSKKYLDFIRSRPCCVSGAEVNVIAHHVRCLGHGGMGLKPPDYCCVPLTQELHQELHDKGERTFWDKYQKDVCVMILLQMSCFLFEKADKNTIDAMGELLKC